MSETVAAAKLLYTLINHVKTWLNNLGRAGEQRKAESLNAVNAVILAVRKTNVYYRARKSGISDHIVEAELAVCWTALSFELDRLELKALAKKCDVTGRYWSVPTSYSKEWLTEASIGLDVIEQLARRVKTEIRNKT